MVLSRYYKEFIGKPKTYEGLFKEVNRVLKELPSLKEPMESLEYEGLCNKAPTGPLPDDTIDVFCVVSKGLERFYVDCYLRTESKETHQFGVYRTLRDGLDSYMKMGMIAGTFTKFAEEYVDANL
ncbi:hypothetical protein AALA24_13500 [Anaerovoracaceae bacterium 42-11]